MKTLYLHVGEPKTGSSFIQALLYKNRDCLQSNKVNYPRGPNDKLMSKNASFGSPNVPRPFLAGRRNPSKELRKISDENNLLLSSELLLDEIIEGGDLTGLSNSTLHSFQRIGVDGLKAIASAAGYQRIEIFLITRDPMPQAMSWYNQIVKMHRHTGSLEQTFESLGGPIRVANLIKSVEKMNGIGLTICKYEVVRKNLVNELEDWLGLVGGTLSEPDHSLVNRSLTRGEMLVQLHLNRTAGRYAPKLAMSPRFSYVSYKHDPDILPSRETQIEMHDRLHCSIEYVNARLPDEHKYGFQINDGRTENIEVSMREQQLEFFAVELGCEIRCLQSMPLHRVASFFNNINRNAYSRLRHTLGRIKNTLERSLGIDT